MPIPDGFTFSQGKIQDYLDCQRLFYLKYVQKLSWPSVIAEPPEVYERQSQLGQRFHQMIRQYFTGISGDRIFQMARDDELRVWWKNFLHLKSEPGELGFIWRDQSKNYPEQLIITSLTNFKISAKFDLISVAQDHLVFIVDWKTSRNRPPSIWLNNRIQTKLYPYLLVEAGSFINHGRNIDPEEIEMFYWFVNYPDQPYRYIYDSDQHLENKKYLNILIDEINQKGENDYMMTASHGRCGYCAYRSLCDRGSRASNIDHLILFNESSEELVDPEFSLEHIPDIAF